MKRLIACVLTIFLAACTSPGANSSSSSTPLDGEAIVLNVASKVDDRVRTQRELVVTEFVSGKKLKVSESESYITEVLDIDSAGNALRVKRIFERSLRRVKFAGEDEVEEHSSREGCEFELVQLADGVSIRLLNGQAEPDDYRALLIAGFDNGLVPRGTVYKGQSWEININDNPYFRNLLKLVGLSAPRNILRAQLFEVADGVARISLRWKTAGTLETGQPIVFELHGELHVHIENRLVSRVSLAGGKTDANGNPLQQIVIHITREHVSSWYR